MGMIVLTESAGQTENQSVHPYAQMRSQAFDWLVEKRLVPLAEWSARIERVTVEDVQQVLQRFPLREKQVLTAYGPLGEQELR